MFESLSAVAADPILHLAALFEQDKNPYKVDLGIGVYKDENEKTTIMKAVSQAEKILLQQQTTKAYIGISGSIRYCELMSQMILGKNHSVLAGQRLSSAQTPGGTGALRVAAEFLKKVNPDSTVWLSNPTWSNHIPLLTQVGFRTRFYPYYNDFTKKINFPAMMDALENAVSGDIVLLHGCCHNPSGTDLDPHQWQLLASMMIRKGLLPLIDIAYQGLGDGIDEDVLGVRLLADQLPEMLIASSCSKNFGIYRERTGIILILSANQKQAMISTGQLLGVIRTNYSMPPAHGASVVETILEDSMLNQSWTNELTAMRKRIFGLRCQFARELTNLCSDYDFSFIAHQKGMFSFLGLTPTQVQQLINKYSIYLVSSSRINVAGLNQTNLQYVINSVMMVIKS